MLDNEPVNDHEGKVRLRSELAAGSDNIREHMIVSEFGSGEAQREGVFARA
jgi:hypothetical protein